MKTSQIVETLRQHNLWRRGGKQKMISPKKLGETIDEAIERLKALEKMFDAGLLELQSEKLYNEHLLSVLCEIETVSKDEIVKKIVKNGKERHELDKMIHAMILFEN